MRKSSSGLLAACLGIVLGVAVFVVMPLYAVESQPMPIEGLHHQMDRGEARSLLSELSTNGAVHDHSFADGWGYSAMVDARQHRTLFQTVPLGEPERRRCLTITNVGVRMYDVRDQATLPSLAGVCTGIGYTTWWELGRDGWEERSKSR